MGVSSLLYNGALGVEFRLPNTGLLLAKLLYDLICKLSFLFLLLHLRCLYVVL